MNFPTPILLTVGLVAGASPASADVLRVGRDGESIAAVLSRAADGDVVEVPPGVYRETGLRVERRVTLRGIGGVIDGGGVGTVLVVDAPGAIVEDLEVRGSGSDLGAPHCCIYTTPNATGARVRRNRLEDCAFGIWVHETDGVVVEGNHVEGRASARVADRGNGIHLFDGQNLVVRGNEVYRSRDGIYVSATEDSLIADNRVEHQRFGVHYMYSHRNTVRGNVARHNTVGLALMESRELHVERNVAEDNERDGLLFRGAQYCRILDNDLSRNGHGLFFYSSTENEIVGNRVVHNRIGAKIWAGSLRNRISGNQFIGNEQQVFFVGSQDLVWGDGQPGNVWSDYLGWDQDGDGIGDREHRMGGFTANMVYRYPSAALLMRSPALELLAHLAGRMAILRVPTVVDRSPLMRAPAR